MVDQAAEPLIADHDHYGHPTPPLHQFKAKRGLSSFMWALTFSAGISGLLFGCKSLNLYDTGVISATLITINDSLSHRFLTTLDKSLITASTSLCAFLISPISGTVCDRLGRKPTLAASSLLFILGAGLQAFADHVWVMIVGRGVVGLAVGVASFVTPLYIAELAPKDFRGRLVTLNVGLITAGQVIAYIVGWFFAINGGTKGWRWMVGLGAVPAIVQAILLIAMPESPRWLMKDGAIEQARQVFIKIYGEGSHGEVEQILSEIEGEIRDEEDARKARIRNRSAKTHIGYFGETWDLLGIPSHRRALTIACLLQSIQQLCGFNSLMYFSATIFSILHFATPTLTSLSVAITNLLFTLLSLILIDRIGRRRILLLSIPIMAVSLLFSALFFSYLDLDFTSPATTTPTSSSATKSSTMPVLILISIIIYVASYAVGIGNVPWQQSELFPLSVRCLGSSISTATNWGGNFIVGITFLPMLEILSPTITFAVYAGVCVVGWFAVWLCYPETCGLSLEEVAVMLRSGWGVSREV